MNERTCVGVAGVALAAFVLACGGPPEASSPNVLLADAGLSDAGPPLTAPGPSLAFEGAGASVVRRSALRDVLALGPASFLQRIELEARPATRNGRFYGFRVARLTGDPGFWRGVDLRPGDVLVHVNGQPIERPEHLLALMKVLDAAPALDVELERSGETRHLRYPIVDDATH